MKLLRYGRPGAEKPGILDADGKIRDLSGVVEDINPATLSPASLRKLAKLDLSDLPAVRGKPADRAMRHTAAELRLHRPELRRPCRRDGRPDPEGADRVPEVARRLPGPERRREDPPQLQEDGLGGRAGRDHRHDGALRLRGRRDEARRRLLRGERCQRAGIPGRAWRHLGQGQGLRTRSAPPVRGW